MISTNNHSFSINNTTPKLWAKLGEFYGNVNKQLRILVIGDSMGYYPAFKLATLLQQRIGIGGYSYQIGSNGSGQFNVVYRSTETTGINVSSTTVLEGNYIQVQSGQPNYVFEATQSTKITIGYLEEPGAGSFELRWSRGAGGVAGSLITTINASGASSVYRTYTFTKPIGQNGFAIKWISGGAVKILHRETVDESRNGVMLTHWAIGGSNPNIYTNCPSAIFDGWLQSVNPDVVIYEDKSEQLTTAFLDTLYSKFTTALPNLARAGSFICVSSTPVSNGQVNTNQILYNEMYRDWAISKNQTYIDTYWLFGGQKGYIENGINGDGVHPPNYMYEIKGSYIYNYLHLNSYSEFEKENVLLNYQGNEMDFYKPSIMPVRFIENQNYFQKAKPIGNYDYAYKFPKNEEIAYSQIKVLGGANLGIYGDTFTVIPTATNNISTQNPSSAAVGDDLYFEGRTGVVTTNASLNALAGLVSDGTYTGANLAGAIGFNSYYAQASFGIGSVSNSVGSMSFKMGIATSASAWDTIMNSPDPQASGITHFILLRYDTSVSDTTIKLLINSGGATTVYDTGIVVTNTRTFFFEVLYTNNIVIKLFNYGDRSQVYNLKLAATLSSTIYKMGIGCKSLNGTAKSFRIKNLLIHEVE